MIRETKRFDARISKLHRLLSILRILDNRERCTPESLAERFGINERSIFRDINDLNSAGFAILFDKENNSYSFADPDFTLRDFDLNDSELMALLLGRQFAHNLGKPFENAFQSLLKKARKETGTKTKRRANKMEGMQQFWVDIDPVEGFEKIEPQYNAISKAMDKKLELEIVYHGMHKQDVKKRNIAPYGLFLHNGMWYNTYCRMQNDTREFALDRIKSFRQTSRPYTIPPDSSMDSYFKPGWHIMRHGEPVEIVLRFSKEVARWIMRRKWHSTQETEEQADGSLILKVRVAGTEELKRWTSHWMPHCEVLGPPELRKEVLEDVKKLGKIYGLKM